MPSADAAAPASAGPPSAAPVVPPPSRTSLFAFDAARLREFFEQVPALYRAADAPTHGAYQELLYTIAHPHGPGHLAAIERGFGLVTPQWPAGGREEVLALLDRMRFPETMPISRLRAVPLLTLPVMSHYLHFLHHAYPIYNEASVRALNALGAPVPFTKVRNADVYGLYVAAIEELKERIPYWCVPETNVVLGRIVQAALEAYGAGRA